MGRAICHLRKDRGWLQKELQVRLNLRKGIDDSTISNWENGRSYPTRYLKELRQLFPSLQQESQRAYERLERSAAHLQLGGDALRRHLLRGDTPRRIDRRHRSVGGPDAARARYDDHIRFFQENRSTLARFIRPYYAGVEYDPTFPLLVSKGWIEHRPLELTVNTEKRILREHEGWRDERPRPPMLPGTNELHHVAKGRVNRDPMVRLEDEKAYRLVRVTATQSPAKLEFALSSYFKGINSCEILGAELAAWYSEAFKTGRRMPRPDGSDLPLRGPAEAVFNLTNRHAIAGQCLLLIVLNHRQGNWFYLHDRKHVAEAPNVTSVIPSGTFAPAREEDADHARDFSLRRNALREFAEELLGVPEAQKQSGSIDTFSDHPSVERYIKMFESGALRLYHFGVGLDPITTKPELLGCMVLDMKGVSDQARVTFEDKFEGRSRPVRLDWAELKRWSRDPNMKHAGGACISLALRHGKDILDDFLRAKPRSRSKQGNAKKRHSGSNS